MILREIEPYVLIDIDNFKLINDAYGHTVGDEIIQCVAHNLKNTFADSLIGRFGGDEFTVCRIFPIGTNCQNPGFMIESLWDKNQDMHSGRQCGMEKTNESI
uniref:GGDEF domain-containing protein n=1 Tax=Enterocloster clostridioformis TaxID=1531 RepID=UPI0026F16138|nr:GGDEF domain-containing protein [Enterocloster clostridioformis]